MRRERLGRIALLLGLAGLIAWFWILRSRVEPDATRADVAAPEELREPVRLVFRSGSDSLVVERAGEDYRIVWPFSDRAAITRVKDVARNAVDLEPTRVLSDDTGRYGLDPPRYSLTLVADSGRRWTLAMGDSSAVGAEVYARVEGADEPVFLMRSFTLHRYFHPDPSWLRDPVALPLDSPVIDSLHVWNRTHPLRARRDGVDRWIATSPRGLALDPLPINRTLRELRGPNLRGFNPEMSLGEAGLDPPRAKWIIHQGARSESIAIGGFTDSTLAELYVLPSGRTVVARLSSDFFRDLVDGWPGLAEKHLLAGSPDSLVGIDFLEGGDGGGYRKETGAWVRDPSGVKVAGAKALEFDLGNLSKLSWQQYPLEPLEPRDSRLTLRLAYPSTAETLWLAGVEGDTTALARSSLRRPWGEVEATQFRIWSYRANHPEM